MDHHSKSLESFEQIEPETKINKSAFRIQRIKDFTKELAGMFDSYLKSVNEYLEKNEGIYDPELNPQEDQASYILNDIIALLNRMDDYELLEEDSDRVLQIIEILENLEKEKGSLRLELNGFSFSAHLGKNKKPEIKKHVKQLEDSYTQKIKEVLLLLRMLPADKESNLKFESGHKDALVDALAAGDYKRAANIIEEIDKLISEDYVEYQRNIQKPTKTTLVNALNYKDRGLPAIDKLSGNRPGVILSNGRLLMIQKGDEAAPEKIMISLPGATKRELEIWSTIA